MGVIHRQMVICITYDMDSNDRTDLDKLVEENPGYFAKSPSLINGVMSYVMFWDGSKEGWDISNKGDNLREKFFKLTKKLEHAHIYEVSDHEEDEPRLYYVPISNWQSSQEEATKQ